MSDLEDGVDAQRFGQVGTSTVEQEVGGVDAFDFTLKTFDGSGVGELETCTNVLDGVEGIVEGCNNGLEEAEHRSGWVRRDRRVRPEG